MSNLPVILQHHYPGVEGIETNGSEITAWPRDLPKPTPQQLEILATQWQAAQDREQAARARQEQALGVLSGADEPSTMVLALCRLILRAIDGDAQPLRDIIDIIDQE